jgi:hypothetical protein
MADKYMDLTKGLNYNDGRVSAPIMLPCWLEEGTVTVGSANTVQYKGSMLALPSQTYASPLAIDDVVQLASSSSSYTFDALQGKPIVSVVASSGGVIGNLVTYPTRPVHTPAATTDADSVAERVAGLYYRVGTVRMFGVQYQPVIVLAQSTAIAIGDHLVYHVAEGKWEKESSTTVSPVIACHAAHADNVYVGALFLGGIATSTA